MKPDVSLTPIVDTPLFADGLSRKSTTSITGSFITRCRLETFLSQGAFSGNARPDGRLDAIEGVALVGFVPWRAAIDSRLGFGDGVTGFGGATVFFGGMVGFGRPLSAACAVALASHWGLTGSNTNSGLFALGIESGFPDRDGQVGIVASWRVGPPVNSAAGRLLTGIGFVFASLFTLGFGVTSRRASRFVNSAAGRLLKGIGFVFASLFTLGFGVTSRRASRFVNSAAGRLLKGIGFVFTSLFTLGFGVTPTGGVGLSLTTVLSGAILDVGSGSFRCDACLLRSNGKDFDARGSIIENDVPCLPTGFTGSVLATEECAFADGAKAAGFDIGTVMAILATGGCTGCFAGSVLLVSLPSTGFLASGGSSSDNTILLGAAADSVNRLSKPVNEGEGRLKPSSGLLRSVSTGDFFPIMAFKTIPVVVSGFANVPLGLMATFLASVGTISRFGATPFDETQISALVGSADGVLDLISLKANLVSEDLLGDVDIDSGSSADAMGVCPPPAIHAARAIAVMVLKQYDSTVSRVIEQQRNAESLMANSPACIPGTLAKQYLTRISGRNLIISMMALPSLASFPYLGLKVVGHECKLHAYPFRRA